MLFKKGKNLNTHLRVSRYMSWSVNAEIIEDEVVELTYGSHWIVGIYVILKKIYANPLLL